MLVNLSRVLATEPQLILADEPTAALDPYHQLLVLELFRKLSRQGLGIILVLHDLQLAARFCDRLLLLHQGKMVSEGSPARVLSTTNLAQSYRINASYDSAVGTVTVLGRL
jgi:iron complex transport system ATP-binding protein